jgi:peptidoglycan hydrolase-like protein with peptidoglycan-binding domain
MRNISSIVLLALFVVPFISNAQSVSSLQAQTQALLQQVAQLQAQSGSATTINSSACPNIGRTLRLGSSGSDVTRLQQFLARDTSVYPEGTASGYYGTLTQSAVSRWQSKYNIVSAGSPSTTGWGVVGPRTAAAIALLCSTGSTAGSVQNNTSPTVGGVIQVTPISGSAPLQVSIQATLNTTASCVGATYLLNYGDGSQTIAIPVASGTCQPVSQSFGHTYSYGGTYQITLTAGAHQTNATITVAGLPSPAQQAASGIPADSIKASITSGAAPLAVVFTGTVSSYSAYGCTGTCTETLNFGDGAVGLIQLPASSGAGATWQSYVINHTYTSAGTYVAQLQSATGAAIASPISISATGPVVATPATSTTPTGGSYGIITITPNVGGNPLAVGAFVALPSCAAYQINWGDASPISTQTAACTSGGSTMTVNHTYATAGSYTVRLNDGTGVVQASSGVSISN